MNLGLGFLGSWMAPVKGQDVQGGISGSEDGLACPADDVGWACPAGDAGRTDPEVPPPIAVCFGLLKLSRGGFSPEMAPGGHFPAPFSDINSPSEPLWAGTGRVTPIASLAIRDAPILYPPGGGLDRSSVSLDFFGL